MSSKTDLEKENKWYRELHWQIAVGMLLGVLVGIFLKDNQMASDILLPIVDLGGKIFLRLLKMVVLPLVIASLLLGVMGVGSTKDLSKIGSKTIIYYIFTSLIAITVGLVFVNILSPGTKVKLDIGDMAGKVMSSPSSLSEIFIRMVPENPIGSMAAVPFDMLGVLFFIILFGIFALQVSEAKRKPIADFADSLNEIMLKMVHGILAVAPIGVFCLVAKLIMEVGVQVFGSLAWYLVTVMLALGFHFFVITPILYFVIRRENPYKYMQQMSPALLTAFSSASSAATLSLTMKCSQKNKRVSSKVSSIVLPLGATINMDGTALYEGVAVLFIAQVMGVDLSFFQQFLVLITALLASVGAAGIPHAGLAMMVVILETVGLPLEATGMILAVDRVVDMARTAVNVWSDSVGAAIVEKVS
ncbi:MAG: dicarboxylate/amino acid:cation symporter [Bdellovibrionales bacterium]